MSEKQASRAVNVSEYEALARDALPHRPNSIFSPAVPAMSSPYGAM